MVIPIKIIKIISNRIPSTINCINKTTKILGMLQPNKTLEITIVIPHLNIKVTKINSIVEEFLRIQLDHLYQLKLLPYQISKSSYRIIMLKF
jgi:hypothetical protein